MWSLHYSSHGTSTSEGAVLIITNPIRWRADFSSLDPKPQGLNSTPKPCQHQTLNPKPLSPTTLPESALILRDLRSESGSLSMHGSGLGLLVPGFQG